MDHSTVFAEWWQGVQRRTVKSYPSHRAALTSISVALSLCCEIMDMGLVHRTVCLFMPRLSVVPNYTAWWQGHMGLNKLPRVVMHPRPGQGSNLWPLDHKSGALPLHHHISQRAMCTPISHMVSWSHTSLPQLNGISTVSAGLTVVTIEHTQRPWDCLQQQTESHVLWPKISRNHLQNATAAILLNKYATMYKN